MAEKPRPLSKEQAPEPSNVYERSHPESEAGMGRLDNNARATPTKSVDKMPNTVSHAQDGSRQINAHDDAENKSSVGNNEPVGWEGTKQNVKKRKK
jgi:hypothetical protein